MKFKLKTGIKYVLYSDEIFSVAYLNAVLVRYDRKGGL